MICEAAFVTSHSAPSIFFEANERGHRLGLGRILPFAFT
jgi:hypothetical protein